MKISGKQGIIKMAILILVALLVLAYFGFNLRSIVNSPTFQDNWNFLGNLISTIWTTYLKNPATYLWSQVYIPLIWEPMIHGLTAMKGGGGTISASSSPVVNPYPFTPVN